MFSRSFGEYDNWSINYRVTGRGKLPLQHKEASLVFLSLTSPIPPTFPIAADYNIIWRLFGYIDVYSITEIWPYKPYYLLTLSTIFMYEFMAINNNVCNVCHQEQIFNPTGWFKFENVIS